MKQTKNASDVVDIPEGLSLTDEDPFVEDEDETDTLVSPTLKFREPGT